jgi:hypothetical protein
MKLTQFELASVGLLVVYTAFFSHPPPSHISNFLESPVGHAVILLGILYIVMKVSFVIALFAGIAYMVTARPSFEYLDPKEQKPTEQPKATGIPSPAITGMLASMLSKQKGDIRLPQTAGKDMKTKPMESIPPKPKDNAEHFTSF